MDEENALKIENPPKIAKKKIKEAFVKKFFSDNGIYSK
jgi:hypothetical protein